MANKKSTKKKVAKATKAPKEKKAVKKDMFKRKAFAAWFAKLMQDNNYTFRTIANAMGVTNPTISKALNGEELSLQSYAIICRFGKVSLDKFIV